MGDELVRILTEQLWPIPRSNPSTP